MDTIKILTINKQIANAMALLFPEGKFLPVLPNTAIIAELTARQATTLELSAQLLKNNEADVLLISATSLPYPLPEGLQIVALFDINKVIENSGSFFLYAAVTRFGRPHLWRFFAPLDIQRKYGKVTLAGFGPGDPDLLTIKAKKAINEADVIFYDSLIDTSVLENAKAEKIFAGKRKGVYRYSQDEINELLYQSALMGKNTLRLKGGDPNVFGRGGEEFHYLRQRFVHVEVIPGITSALSAAAFAGFPLTHRGVSSSIAIVNGSSKNLQIPAADTLAFYMGATNTKNIATELIAQGFSGNYPVAIVSKTGFTEAGANFYNLEQLLELEIDAPTPAIVFAGNVCQYANHNTLHKRRVLYTGVSPAHFNETGTITHIPFIEIKNFEPAVYLFEIIENIDLFDFIVFTSRHAVVHFMQFLNTTGRDTRHLAKNKIVSSGKTASNELRNYGLVPDYEALEESSQAIANIFSENKIRGKRILLPRSDIARNILPNALRLEGNTVDVITVYSAIMPKNIPDIDFETFDAIVFTSPGGFQNFIRRFCQIPKHIEVITKGGNTQKAYDDWKLQSNYVI